MSDVLNTEVQELAMIIIANSGEAKGLAFSALKCVREENDVLKAKDLLEEASKFVSEAHMSQTKILTMSASESGVSVDVLLVHAQDHLMTTMMSVELISEIVLLIESR